jgi:PAH dioxygenase small subunit
MTASRDASAEASDIEYMAISRLLVREAGLLDERAYQDWLSLWTADLSYRVMMRSMRDLSQAPIDYAIIDEDRIGLTARVSQISQAGLTKAENPPSLTCRFISNVEVYHSGQPDQLIVRSNIMAHRVRGTAVTGTVYVGKRLDTVLRSDKAFHLHSREVRLDQSVIFDGALAILL